MSGTEARTEYVVVIFIVLSAFSLNTMHFNGHKRATVYIDVSRERDSTSIS